MNIYYLWCGIPFHRIDASEWWCGDDVDVLTPLENDKSAHQQRN